MGQSPEAKMFYGLHYKSDEFPDEVASKMEAGIDPPDFIYDFMGITQDETSAEARGTFGTFTVNNRKDLVLYGFSVVKSGWGLKQFSMPSLEELGSMRDRLLALAAKVGFPTHKEPGWYLEADFG